MNNYVRILELSEGNYRNLKFKKVDLSKIESGHLRILGNVGAGKTNLIEMLEIATKDNPKVRNKEINPNFNQKAQYTIQFSDSIYLGFSKTPNGGFDYSLYKLDEAGNKITALNEKGVKMTASDYKKTLTTELTYGVDEFLSDNPTVQYAFLKKIYQKELIRLGLIGDDNDPNTLNYKLIEAIKNRDNIQVKQSQAGAYKVHLEKLIKPDYVDIDALQLNKTSVLQQIEAKKKDIINYNAQKQQEVANQRLNAEREANNRKNAIEAKINRIVAEMQAINTNSEQSYKLAVAECEKRVSEHNKRVNDYAELLDSAVEGQRALHELSIHIFTKPEDKAELLEKISDIFYVELPGLFPVPKLINLETETAKIVKGEILPTELIEVEAWLSIPENAESPYKDRMFNLLQEYKELSLAVTENVPDFNPLLWDEQAIITQAGENAEPLEVDLFVLLCEVAGLNTQIETAKESNEIYDKFSIYEKFTLADDRVKEVRAEIKKAYSLVTTGVDGMVLHYDEHRDKVLVMYDGRHFGQNNPEMELSGYSHTQKRYVAAMLQLHLLQQKNRPLNIIIFDEIGMDEKTDKLFADFGRENGLLIITTGTGDYEPNELSDNEILVENGHLIFGDNVLDYTDEEVAKIKTYGQKEKEQEQQAVETAEPKKRGRKKKEDVEEAPAINNIPTPGQLDMFADTDSGPEVINPIDKL